ncbi:hypothetical protein FFI94_032220 [Rhodococcus sp. KBS0724]|nr:hypothetical protein FFI94_032220 [Rhodococcus sp. KBS0724]
MNHAFHSFRRNEVKSKCVVCGDGHCVISSFRLSALQG